VTQASGSLAAVFRSAQRGEEWPQASLRSQS